MLKLAIHLPAFSRILGVQRRATDQVAQPHVSSILRDTPPEQCQYFRSAMFAVDGGAA